MSAPLLSHRFKMHKLAVYGLFSGVKSQGLEVGPERTHAHQHTVTDGW
jgi:hypothetical protein